MIFYPIEVLIMKWAISEITADQAIGQLLVHVQNMQKEIAKLSEQAAESKSPVVPQKKRK